MTNDLVQRTLAGNHWLDDQTQHQERQEDLAAEGANPADATFFHVFKV
jgi:hypothetical protein